MRAFNPRWAVALALAGSVLCSLPAFGSARGEFERTLQVTGRVDLQVETGSGSVEVHRGGSNQVHVVGRISANEWFGGGNAEERVNKIENNPPIQQSGNDIRIGHIDDPELKHNISISYEITVPESTQLRSSSGSGSQTISDIAGPVEVNTGSGGLKLSTIGAGIRAHTGSGSVQLRLPSNASFDLDAHTGSGSIDLSHPVTVQSSIGRREVKGKVGGGGVPVEVQTGSGSIRIE